MSTTVSRGKYISSDVAVEQALSAVAVFPTLVEARKYLREQGYQTDIDKLRHWRDAKYHDRYLEIRKELAPQLEGVMAEDLLTNARYALEVQRIAITRTKKGLQDGTISDPARAGRDLSQIITQATDKRLALQGRPTRIVAQRGLKELVNALEGMGVAQEIIPGTAKEITEEAET